VSSLVWYVRTKRLLRTTSYQKHTNIVLWAIVWSDKADPLPSKLSSRFKWWYSLSHFRFQHNSSACAFRSRSWYIATQKSLHTTCHSRCCRKWPWTGHIEKKRIEWEWLFAQNRETCGEKMWRRYAAKVKVVHRSACQLQYSEGHTIGHYFPAYCSTRLRMSSSNLLIKCNTSVRNFKTLSSMYIYIEGDSCTATSTITVSWVGPAGVPGIKEPRYAKRSYRNRS
jgi:hypothetical protein